MKTRIQTDHAPAALGPYSQAIVTGNMVYTAGQTPIDPATGKLIDGTIEERWEKFYLKAPFGLEWQRDFAKLHRKKMSYPEWGVGQAGDNPLFIAKMQEWLVRNRDAIEYAAYFNVDGLWPTQIDNGKFPQAQALFQKLFAVDERGSR